MTPQAIADIESILLRQGDAFFERLSRESGLAQAFVNDLKDEGLRAAMVARPELGRAWEVLKDAPNELRLSASSLEILRNVFERFSFNSSNGWEALQRSFANLNPSRYDDLLELFHQADEFLDKGNSFSFKLVSNTLGEETLEITGGNSTTRGIVLKRDWASASGLNEDDFETTAKSLAESILPQNVPLPSIPQMILGKDEVVTAGARFPTMPGVLDVHVHGGFEGENFWVLILREDGSIRTKLTAYQLAEIIRSQEPYQNAYAVRLFCCEGAGGGEEIALLLDKPVITSSDKIYVNSFTGRMSMRSGSLVRFVSK